MSQSALKATSYIIAEAMIWSPMRNQCLMKVNFLTPDGLFYISCAEDIFSIDMVLPDRGTDPYVRVNY